MQEALGGPRFCLINAVPGSWLSSPITKAMQFIDIKDTQADQITITGRMGTFEVYANIGAHKRATQLVLLFSKKMSGMWPNVSAAANRARVAMIEA